MAKPKASIKLGQLTAEVEFGIASENGAAVARPLTIRLLLLPTGRAWDADPVEIGHYTYLNDEPAS